jgi:hypothetical protein
MNSYIFLTDEGFTFQPGSESDVPEVENLQVLGLANGDSPEAAFETLLKEDEWLRETTFSECFSLKLAETLNSRHWHTMCKPRKETSHV